MRSVVKTDRAPSYDLPFSQAIKTGNVVFTSGIVGVNPETGEIPADFAEQARQVLSNLTNILEAAGCSKENVVKCSCFLVDIGKFDIFNAVYREFFGTSAPPARSCFQIVGLNNPAFQLEVEAIGCVEE